MFIHMIPSVMLASLSLKINYNLGMGFQHQCFLGVLNWLRCYIRFYRPAIRLIFWPRPFVNGDWGLECENAFWRQYGGSSKWPPPSDTQQGHFNNAVLRTLQEFRCKRSNSSATVTLWLWWVIWMPSSFLSTSCDEKTGSTDPNDNGERLSAFCTLRLVIGGTQFQHKVCIRLAVKIVVVFLVCVRREARTMAYLHLRLPSHFLFQR